MLLKISLGLAILLGLAALFISHTQVGGKIKTLNEDLATTQTSLLASQDEERKLRGETKTLRAQVDESTRALGEATNLLTQAESKAQEQQIRADRASTDLTAVTGERNKAQEELAQWRLFEMSPEQIRNNLSRLRQVERERDVFVTENQTLTRKNTELQGELERYIGGREREVQLPPGTKGNVVAVDPKYDFVVLDIGGNQGVLENAKMLINRDGKLIGKVKISSVQPNRAIGNVLPEWKQDEVMEGDQVLF